MSIVVAVTRLKPSNQPAFGKMTVTLSITVTVGFTQP